MQNSEESWRYIGLASNISWVQCLGRGRKHRMGFRRYQYLGVSKRQKISKESSRIGKSQENLVSMILIEVNFKKERKMNKITWLSKVQQDDYRFCLQKTITGQNDSRRNQPVAKRRGIEGEGGGGGKKKMGLQLKQEVVFSPFLSMESDKLVDKLQVNRELKERDREYSMDQIPEKPPSNEIPLNGSKDAFMRRTSALQKYLKWRKGSD